MLSNNAAWVVIDTTGHHPQVLLPDIEAGQASGVVDVEAFHKDNVSKKQWLLTHVLLLKETSVFVNTVPARTAEQFQAMSPDALKALAHQTRIVGGQTQGPQPITFADLQATLAALPGPAADTVDTTLIASVELAPNVPARCCVRLVVQTAIAVGIHLS